MIVFGRVAAIAACLTAIAGCESEPTAATEEPCLSGSADVAAFDQRFLALDAHGRVDAEPPGALPREHAGSVELVQESVAAEVAKDASLEGGFELAYVIGRQLGGHVKAGFAAGGLCEHTVEHDEVVVRVDVQ